MRSRGFTILELAVVIAIVAILLSVTAGRLAVSAEDARQERTVSDFQNLTRIAQAYWERGFALPMTNLAAAPANLEALMPQGMRGGAARNAYGRAISMSIAGDIATIVLCVAPEGATIANLDPLVTAACPGACAAGCTLTRTQRMFLSDRALRLRLEKRLLYQQ